MGILGLNVGDRINVNMPIYRKPWQFWRPRIVGHERISLVLTEARLRSLHEEEARYLKTHDIFKDVRPFGEASMREMEKLLGLLPR